MKLEREHAKADLEAADKAIAALDLEIATIAPVASPQGRDPLAFIDAWRAKRNEALTLVDALQRSEDAERRAEDEGERTRERLSAALRATGVVPDQNSDLEALIEAAETALSAEAQFAALRQKAEERRAEAARAEAKLRIAKEADANWLRAWREACAGTWLGEAEGEPALGAVKQSLKALDELRATLSVCAELEDRIAKMERDKLLFADEVGAVAAALDLNDVPDDVRQRVDAIEERVARAGENARRRAEKADALKEAHGRLKAIAEELEVNARQASAMTAFFAVETLADVAVKLEDCKRRDALRAEIAREKAADHRRQRRRLARSGSLAPRASRRGGAHDASSRRSRRARRMTTRRMPRRTALIARRSSGWRRSAATTRSRGSKRSGAPFSRRSTTERGAI